MITSGSGSELDRVVIIDGYVDEPTCLGVPPYISPYPRYIAGSIWSHSTSTEIIYQTIDQIRSMGDPQGIWSTTDMVILIAGMIVPGKYIGGTPISVKESKKLFSDPRIEDIPKLLVGPWARFGCGLEGGKLALSSDVLSPPFDYIITGDPEIAIAQILSHATFSEEVLSATRESLEQTEECAVRGSGIITQHPGFAQRHIICEIETYRGCARFITGGCSFCVEPLYGSPKQRKSQNIAKEIEALYQAGVRAFRIGNQADLFTYGSPEMGEEEFPEPSPEAIERLFSNVKSAAPNLEVLHIDNVNPGTLARHPSASRAVAKAIMKHHTPGDVAAFGVESLDPEVVRRNNLKANEDEILTAVRLLNEVGGKRPSWGLPHLLPGINLLYGLPGESKKTLEYNMEFLNRLLDENLLVRRINIRQVIGFEGTRVGNKRRQQIKRNEYFRHKEKIREAIDRLMIRRIAPAGTIIHSTYFEGSEGNTLLLRPLGTYPLLCYMPNGRSQKQKLDVFVTDHGPRSLSVLPYPFYPKQASLSQWKAVPGIGAKRAARIKSAQNLESTTRIEEVLELELPHWFKRTLRFEEN
ncbi:MAG: radical SAM protein [Candidatus Hodarchaeota archaeon]